MKDINVEEIMEGIRKDIQEKGYTSEILSFRDVNIGEITVKDFDLDEFINTVRLIETTKSVSWVADGSGKGLKSFIKRVIRKIIGFVVVPFADGQNMYNQQVAEGFVQLLGFIEKQNKTISEQNEVIEKLQKTIEKTGKQK